MRARRSLAGVAAGALAALPLFAAAAWVQATSPHFVVTSDDGADSARQVAGRLEGLRALFHQLFPGLAATDPPLAIQVLAVRNRAEFRALLPADRLGKGALDLAGYYTPGEDVNRILMRLDTQDEQFPYAVVYHEYTHQITRNEQTWMPTWLTEGLAEYYETAQIEGRHVVLGEVEPGRLEELRSEPRLKVSTLLAVDHNSPYSHERSQGDVFYAEAWALTHMLINRDFSARTHRLADYAEALADGEGAAAAVAALGGEEPLQQELDAYVRQPRFATLDVTLAAPIAETAIAAAPIDAAQADAVRAGFLAGNGRPEEGARLAQSVLQQEPANAAALEALGEAALEREDYAAARDWYQKAARADPKNYFALYAFAAAGLRSAQDFPGAAPALRSALELNPQYAPAYDLLAEVAAMQQGNPSEAYTLELHAIELQPGDVEYRLNAARILLAQQRADAAATAAQNAAALAATPAAQQEVEDVRAEIERYRAALARNHELASPGAGVRRGVAPQAGAMEAGPALPAQAAPEGGPQTASGKIQSIRCHPGSPALDLAFDTGDGTLALHADSFNDVEIDIVSVADSARNTEAGPTCQGWAGLAAVVRYQPAAKAGEAGKLLKLELHP